MPCDTIQTNRVALPKMNQGLAVKAIEAIGGTEISVWSKMIRFNLRGATYTIQGGALVSRAADAGAVADSVKRAYSEAVVRYVAARTGGQIQQTSGRSFVVTYEGGGR
jgi:hypothetical protein